MNALRYFRGLVFLVQCVCEKRHSFLQTCCDILSDWTRTAIRVRKTVSDYKYFAVFYGVGGHWELKRKYCYEKVRVRCIPIETKVA